MIVEPYDATSGPSAQACDVVVIGGGPAGSTVAPLLAQRGYRVVLLERARHPRFHIGESLLPANMPLFERLGIAESVREVGMEKWGAEFVSPWHAERQTFLFADAWNKSQPHSYQVRRSEFDEILIRNAASKGVEVFEGWKATNVDMPDKSRIARVTACDEHGTERIWQTGFVVDASGRDTFLASRLGLKERNPKHNSCAVYGHFSGAHRHTGPAEGHITIFWFDHGWFWFIPLHDGSTSIGMVTWPYFMKTREGRSLEQFLAAAIDQCAALKERLCDARLIGPVQATGNFSYASRRSHGQRYLLLGDAFAFVDPVFSSGVMLAMNSGFAAADAIHTCLARPRLAWFAMRRFDHIMRHGPREFSWFIYRVTNPTMRDIFMAPRNIFRVKEALLSMLAGDIFGKTPIWVSLWIFKLIYYISSLVNWRRSLRAWRTRQISIRDVDDVTWGAE